MMRTTRIGRAWRYGAATLLTVLLAACDGTSAIESAPSVSPASAGAPSAGTPAGSAPTAGPSSAGPPTAASAPAASPRIPTPGRSVRTDGVTLVRTGGIAGLTDTITVRPDGVWQRSDRRGPRDDGRLDATRQAELRQLLADPRLAAEAQRSAGDGELCRDALTYLLVAPPGTIRHTQCPGTGKPPEVTMRIVALLLAATGA